MAEAYLHWPFVLRSSICYVLMLVRNPKLADKILQFKVFLIVFFDYSSMSKYKKGQINRCFSTHYASDAGPSESTSIEMYVHNFQNCNIDA